MYKYKYGTVALFMSKHFIPHSYAMTPHKSSPKRRNSMQLCAFHFIAIKNYPDNKLY